MKSKTNIKELLIKEQDAYFQPFIEKINPDATIEDVYNAPQDVYKTIGLYETELRLYIFEKICELYNESYENIYNEWLYGGKKVV